MGFEEKYDVKNEINPHSYNPHKVTKPRVELKEQYEDTEEYRRSLNMPDGPEKEALLAGLKKRLGITDDEGYLEISLLDVEFIVRRSQDLALVHIINSQSLEDLAFDEVSYSCLGHDGDGDSGLNLFDQLGVRHASNATVLADVGGNSFEGHDGAGTGFFGDASLLGVDDIHDDAALEHLSETGFDGEGGGGGAIIAIRESGSGHAVIVHNHVCGIPM